MTDPKAWRAFRHRSVPLRVWGSVTEVCGEGQVPLQSLQLPPIPLWFDHELFPS